MQVEYSQYLEKKRNEAVFADEAKKPLHTTGVRTGFNYVNVQRPKAGVAAPIVAKNRYILKSS